MARLRWDRDLQDSDPAAPSWTKDQPQLPSYKPPRPWLEMPSVGQAAIGFVAYWTALGLARIVLGGSGGETHALAWLVFTVPILAFLIVIGLVVSVATALLRWWAFPVGVMVGVLTACGLYVYFVLHVCGFI